MSAYREMLLRRPARPRLGGTDRLVAVASATTGSGQLSGRIDRDRISILEAALGSLPEEDSRERALLVGTLCAVRLPLALP